MCRYNVDTTNSNDSTFHCSFDGTHYHALTGSDTTLPRSVVLTINTTQFPKEPISSLPPQHSYCASDGQWSRTPSCNITAGDICSNSSLRGKLY